MNDEVRVTLQAEGFSKDFILPVNVSLRELYHRLHKVLKIVDQSRFGKYSGVILENDGAGMSDLNATLYDYGVKIGSYLTVVEKRRYYGFEE